MTAAAAAQLPGRQGPSRVPAEILASSAAMLIGQVGPGLPLRASAQGPTSLGLPACLELPSHWHGSNNGSPSPPPSRNVKQSRPARSWVMPQGATGEAL